MSKFSGQFDLADYIMGKGGWLDKDGNSVRFDDKNIKVLYSDELKDFEAFKASTGGKIYQQYRKKLDKFNIDETIKNEEKFVLDYSTTKNKYLFFGEEKTLAQINKEGYYGTKEIKFETLLDLIPYYPYLIFSSMCRNDIETVYISSRSCVDEEEEKLLTGNFTPAMPEIYRRELRDHIIEVVKKYY